MNQAEVAGGENKKTKKPALFKKLSTFQTPDGKVFDTQKEASEWIRRHLVDDALKALCGGEGDVTINWQWLKDNKDNILKAYDAAKIERPPVTEETKAKMKAARAKLKALAEQPAA